MQASSVDEFAPVLPDTTSHQVAFPALTDSGIARAASTEASRQNCACPRMDFAPLSFGWRHKENSLRITLVIWRLRNLYLLLLQARIDLLDERTLHLPPFGVQRRKLACKAFDLLG